MFKGNVASVEPSCKQSDIRHENIESAILSCCREQRDLGYTDEEIESALIYAGVYYRLECSDGDCATFIDKATALLKSIRSALSVS